MMKQDAWEKFEVVAYKVMVSMLQVQSGWRTSGGCKRISLSLSSWFKRTGCSCAKGGLSGCDSSCFQFPDALPSTL